MSIFSLLRKFRQINTIYCRLKPNWILLTCVNNDRHIDGATEIIVDNSSNRVLAVGASGETEASVKSKGIDCRVENAFSDLEQQIQNTDIAEATLKYYMKKISESSVIVRPLIIFHVLERKNPYNPDELKAWVSIGESAGARSVYLWKGDQLSNSQILAGEFYGGEWIGNKLKY